MNDEEMQGLGKMRWFAKNKAGRDFVVGDIHGEFSLVIEALERVGFDGRVDRLFCVGDLIDRGGENAKVLEFLAREGIHSIMGNHEDDLTRTAKSPAAQDRRLLDMVCREMGQSWWFELEDALRAKIVEVFEALPLGFEIETDQGLVGIVHAEPVPSLDWAYFRDLLDQGESMAMDSALWGREIAEGREEGCFGDIWRVFAGHTPAPEGAMKFGNLFCIDTGAVFGKLSPGKKGHLTLARIDAPEEELICPRKSTGLIEIKGVSGVAASPRSPGI